MGFTVLGSGSGNATVPGDAPIQPVQAYVDAQLQDAANDNGYNLDWSNLGIESIDWTHPFITTLAARINGRNYQNSTTSTYKLNDNKLDTAAKIDAAIAFAELQNVSIDVSGTNMAVPTPDAPPDDGLIDLDFSAAVDGSFLFGSGVLIAVIIDSSAETPSFFEFADGTYYFRLNSDATANAASMAAKLTELAGPVAAFSATDNLDGTMTLRGLFSVLLLTTGDWTSPFTPNGIVASNITSPAFHPNADITGLNSQGKTAKVMEYVNRASGAKEAVTYAP